MPSLAGISDTQLSGLVLTQDVHTCSAVKLNKAISEAELQDLGIVNEESVQKDENVQTQPEIIDEAGLQIENFILIQEIKYLKKINKAKDKLIKALRRKV